MPDKEFLRVLAALFAALLFSFSAKAFASMPAWMVTNEVIEAAQGTWYDLDGNVAFVVEGDRLNGRRIVHALNFAGPHACHADFFLDGENLGDSPAHFIRWLPNRRFLTLDGTTCRNTREPEYFESVRGVYLGMKLDDMFALLGEPERNIKNRRFEWPDVTVNTEDGIVTAIFLPKGGARLDGSGLGADDTPEDFAAAYGFPEAWNGQESREIGNSGEYLQRKEELLLLSLFERQ